VNREKYLGGGRGSGKVTYTGREKRKGVSGVAKQLGGPSNVRGGPGREKGWKDRRPGRPTEGGFAAGERKTAANTQGVGGEKLHSEDKKRRGTERRPIRVKPVSRRTKRGSNERVRGGGGERFGRSPGDFHTTSRL